MPATPSPPPFPVPRPETPPVLLRRRRPPAFWAVAAVATAAFCVQLDSFALNAALPAARAALRGSGDAAPWVVGGYLLAAGALMPVAGRLGDLCGQRRVLAAGLALFAAASMLCALAPSLPLLVAARVLQGTGGALIMPAGLALLTRVHPPGEGRRAIGRALGVAGLATAGGPFVGGALAEWVSWRAVFWLSVPLCAAAALCAHRAPDPRDPQVGRPPLDLLGAVTVTGAPACLAYWLQRPAAWGWAVAAAALGALFVRAERRCPAPLVDLALFRNRRYVALTAAGAVANAATVALLYAVPLLLQQGRGWPAVGAGAALLAPAAALAAGGPLAGRVPPVAAVPVMAGCLSAAAVALWAAGCGAGAVALVMTVTVAAAALGVAGGLALTGSQSVVRRERAGEAAGVTKAVLTATAGAGLALAPAVAPEADRAGGLAGLHSPLALAAASCLAAAVVAGLLGRETRR
ncbi:MFS transporter [Streptomyces sp. NPDC020742]|uniref:MFS transporter n=1 Tax=Streptomyces sp. NPDC020742 TaxID=3154897 RepID=UPI0033F87AC8